MTELAHPQGRRFLSSSFRRVVIAHVVVFGLLAVYPLFNGLFKPKPPETFAVQMVVLPPPGDVVERPTDPALAPERPAPRVEPAPRPEPKPEPVKQPRKRKPIKRQDGKRVKLNPRQPPKTPRVSEIDIHKALNSVPTFETSDIRTQPTDAANQEFARVAQALKGAWRRPVREQTGRLSAELTIRLGPGGVITGSTVTRESGNVAMDASVAAIGERVKHIRGLSSEFIRSHKSITITFDHDGL